MKHRSAAVLLVIVVASLAMGATLYSAVPRQEGPFWNFLPLVRRDPSPTPPPTATPTPTPTPVPTPIPGAAPNVYDCDGQIGTTEWLTSTFGAVGWQWGPESGARLIELHCSIGPAVLVVHVQDAAGNPVEGVTVVRYWPGAPALPPDLAEGAWHDQGVYGATNAGGDIGFGMGAGDYYWPPSAGASEVWVAGDAGSDLMTGLGMIAATNHQHLDSVFGLPGGFRPAKRGFTPGAEIRQVPYRGGSLPVVTWPANQPFNP